MEALGSTRDLGTGHLVFIFYISFLEVTCISQGFALTSSLCTGRVLLICQPLLIPTAAFGLYVCCADHVEWESLLFFAWTPFYILMLLESRVLIPLFSCPVFNRAWHVSVMSSEARAAFPLV